MQYKGMVAWGWDVPRLIVRYKVIHATKGKEVNLDLTSIDIYEVIHATKGQPNQLRYAKEWRRVA